LISKIVVEVAAGALRIEMSLLLAGDAVCEGVGSWVLAGRGLLAGGGRLIALAGEREEASEGRCLPMEEEDCWPLLEDGGEREGGVGDARGKSFYIYITILHKLGDFDAVDGTDLNLNMASSVQSLKTLLQHRSSSIDAREIILEFVAGSTLQFYIGLHTGSFKVLFGGLRLCPFPDSYCGRGTLLKMVKHFHADRGVDSSTFVISELASREEMLRAEGFFVDEHWLRQENTLNLVRGGGVKPSAVDRERADGFVANWIGRQSASWRQQAEILFRLHKERRDAAKPGLDVPVPILFVKQARTFVAGKPDPEKRKEENARAKLKLKAIKMGIELPKTAQPARHKANSYSACAKEPSAEKVFKGFCICKKSHCLKLYCFCRNSGVVL
jgi:hypothetical protein